MSSSTLSERWDLVRKYHIHQADALQIVSCMRLGTVTLLSADKALLEAAENEGLSSVNIEDAQDVEEKILKR